jgi:hypothetical protein
MKKYTFLFSSTNLVPTFAQNFNKVKVDSLFQVLKTNDKFMEVLHRKTGKSFTRMPSGRTI